MSKKSNKKVHKVLAYLLTLVLLITAVPVAVSNASDYTVPSSFTSQAAAYKAEWEAKGNDGKTTLFIGDSFMSPQIWNSFYDTYQGKDVLRAGIGSSAARDWQVFTESFLAYTSPKNLVVNLGTNDITGTGTAGTSSQDADTVSAGLQTLFTAIHATLPDTNVYYFGISARAAEKWMDTVNAVNTTMQAWCAEDAQKDWITYVDTSAVVASDLYDGVHLKPECYSKLVNALAATDIVIEDSKKNMDIYLITGQSNGAGWTQYEESDLLAMDSRYVNGFENIYYSGTVATVGDMANTTSTYDMQLVKAGLGTQTLDKPAMGPEVGMADVLSSRYNSETGEYAGIIKYAIGAAPLVKDPEKPTLETWTSPTYMEKLGTDVTDGTNMGVLYGNFLDEVTKRLAEYEEAGYNPIIKGMYWMQGEGDRRREAEYIEAFEDFASDVRKDLTTKTGQDLSSMPIMIGEISETFYAYKTTTLNANREFIAMQDMLPSLVSDCYLIDNSGFAITAEDPDNPEPSDQNSEEYAAYKGIILGSDYSHWNYQDCITIGKQVGDQILEWDEVATGDVNADTKVDRTDLGNLRKMLVRNVDDASRFITPDVYVSYDGGQVVNDGDSSIVVGTYKIDSSAITPLATTEDDYTTSRNGDAKGAIITNHTSGPHTVVKDYEFGKDDFTVSTWFNVPDEATLGSGAGTYLIGNDQPGGTDGFSLTLKSGSIRFKVLSLSSRELKRVEGTGRALSFDRNEWYNLVLSREGSVIKVYFDGALLFTESIPEGYDFGTKDIGVGAYVGATYNDCEMRFDDVQIYGSALTASQVKAIAETDVLIPERNDVNLDEAFNVKDLVDLKIAAANYTGATPFDVEAADAVVNYNNSTVANSGTNSSITAGAYVLNAEKNSTSFDPATSIQYGAGVDGTENGAIITNNLNGAYTVLDKLNLGKDDFVVSTWFNVPEEKLDSGNTNYLLGTTRAGDTTNGFRVTMRATDAGVQLAYKAGANGQELYTLGNFDYGEWHHVAVSRIGNALFLYYDGELAKIQIIGDDFDFGDAKLAFGAQVGETWSYKDTDVMYDEVRFYKGEVTVAHVREIYAMEEVPGGDDSGDVGGDTGDDTTEPTTAKVRVTFDGGKVANSGTDTSATAGAYVMDATTNGTKFVETNAVSYATGRDGSANGAIITEHKTGPYTVIKNCNFGTDDFTVSTWFNTEKASAIGNNASFYLFGTNKPDTGKGFSICIKKVSEEFRLRIRGAYKSTNESIVIPDIVSNTWYNVTIARVGTVINLYFDGSLVGTYTVDAYDFENRELAFGGYYGLADEYYGVNTYFDDIYVYGEGLSASEIREEIMGMDSPKARVTFDGGTVANSGTDTTITANTYVLDGTAAFKAADTVTYEIGRDGSANGAIVTNHLNGPYAVLDKCSLGTGDFTISAWFNPQNADSIVNQSGGYLLGTVHPESGNGFSVVLKKSGNGNYQIRFRGAGAGAKFSEDAAGVLPTITSNTWYNVVVARVGETLNIYFNGEKVFTQSVGTYDFLTTQLAFGAYFGKTYYYDADIHFDDIEVYGVGLSDSQVQKMYTMTK